MNKDDGGEGARGEGSEGGREWKRTNAFRCVRARCRASTVPDILEHKEPPWGLLGRTHKVWVVAGVW